MCVVYPKYPFYMDGLMLRGSNVNLLLLLLVRVDKSKLNLSNYECREEEGKKRSGEEEEEKG